MNHISVWNVYSFILSFFLSFFLEGTYIVIIVFSFI